MGWEMVEMPSSFGLQLKWQVWGGSVFGSAPLGGRWKQNKLNPPEGRWRRKAEILLGYRWTCGHWLVPERAMWDRRRSPVVVPNVLQL
eukprot:15365465-Ditylum_brightwellii.AAC.3